MVSVTVVSDLPSSPFGRLSFSPAATSTEPGVCGGRLFFLLLPSSPLGRLRGSAESPQGARGKDRGNGVCCGVFPGLRRTFAAGLKLNRPGGLGTPGEPAG